MATLLFDLRASQPLTHGHHGGAEYARAIFDRLADTPRACPILAFYDTARPLPPDIEATAARAEVELVGLTQPNDLQRLVDTRRGDRFYSALPYEYRDLNLGDMDVLFTVHGLRALEAPADRYAPRYASTAMQFSIAQAKRVLAGAYKRMKERQFTRLLAPRGRRRRLIVPSEHTKYSLLITFPWLRPEDILVSYSPRTAVCAREDTDPALIERLGLVDRGYVLLVSSNRWVKNGYRAILAVEELIRRRADFPVKRIVAVGGAPARAPVRWRRQHLFLEGVDVRTLATLYRHAFVLLYPSLSEGFGYPPLESMSYGTPVIASAASAITEIAGDGAVYAMPQSTDEMQNRLCWLAQDSRAWSLWSEKALHRYRVISEVQDRMLDELCQVLVRFDE